MMRNQFDPSMNFGQMIFRVCLALPWERILVKPVAPFRPPVYVPPARRRRPPPPGWQPADSMPLAAAPAPSLPVEQPVEQPVPVVVPQVNIPKAIDRPGCTAADEAAVALFHLDGLARGKGGFGVLRVSKERLETAAAAAEGIKHPEVAQAYRAIAAEMPNVHDPQAAAALRDRLEPVVYDQSWDLGRKCKGALTPEDMEEIKALAAKIAAKQQE